MFLQEITGCVAVAGGIGYNGAVAAGSARDGDSAQWRPGGSCMARQAEMERSTKETRIGLSLVLDGTGQTDMQDRKSVV